MYEIWISVTLSFHYHSWPAALRRLQNYVQIPSFVDILACQHVLPTDLI